MLVSPLSDISLLSSCRSAAVGDAGSESPARRFGLDPFFLPRLCLSVVGLATHAASASMRRGLVGARNSAPALTCCFVTDGSTA
jgi:hypothetical protein